MRILALPLTRRSNPPVFFHVNPSSQSFPRIAHQTAFLRNVTSFEQWSATKWKELSQSQPKSVSHRVWVAGERMKKWADWRESLLMKVPGVNEVAWEHASNLKVYYPANIPQSHIENQLSAIVAKRAPHHQRRLMLCIIALPFSALFGVVPGPNVPLIWNLYRLYSNWRALQGGKTLQRAKLEGRLEFIGDTNTEEILANWQQGYLTSATVKPLGAEWGEELCLGVSHACQEHQKSSNAETSGQLHK
ncbi:mitochondrial K+-H+ exchange-related-domain-containing protein [Gaertneriomyces semiglobifer]|nr:mitochondrial K+-H+ exchange-related-domain-containing protein [Gaertneriomyces semiglobifer]